MPERVLKLTIEYDGTGYSGWQTQKNSRAIQDVVEEAVEAVTGEKSRVHGAGRTDAGVHALGQVAHLKTSSEIPALNLAKAVNTHLPPDIAVVNALNAPADFHAQYDPSKKLYRYSVNTRLIRPAVKRNYHYHFPRKLNLDAIRECTAQITGKVDFKAFQSSTEKDIPTVKNMTRAEAVQNGEVFTFGFEADGFLYKMVRNIVGTLLWAGEGKITADEFSAILKSRDRKQAGPAVPGHGLTLVRITYESKKNEPADV